MRLGPLCQPQNGREMASRNSGERLARLKDLDSKFLRKCVLPRSPGGPGKSTSKTRMAKASVKPRHVKPRMLKGLNHKLY